MNNITTPEAFFYTVREMRHKVFEAGGQPDTLRISKSEIEKFTLSGMKILIVEGLPDDTFMLVSDDRSIRDGNTKNS